MIRPLALAAVLAAAPALALAQPTTQTIASQPVPNPPPQTTENGPGTADPGYSGQLQGQQFRDVWARIAADESAMAGNKRGMSALRGIKAEANMRKARHGGELRDWDRELLNKKLDMLEGKGG